MPGNKFEQLAQGSEARGAQLDAFKASLASQRMVIVEDRPSDSFRLPRRLAVPVACVLGVLAISCAPTARGSEGERLNFPAVSAGEQTRVPAAPPEPLPPTPTPKSAEASPTSKPAEPTLTPPPIEPPPTATATQPAKNEGEQTEASCSILPAEYCGQGQLIHTKNRLGQPEIYIGFRSPANVPIFAGMDGQALKAKMNQPSAQQGLLVTIRDPNLGNPNAIAIDVVGDLQLDNMSTVNVKKGDIIGYTQDTGIKNFGDYNLIITIRRLDPSVGRAVPDEELLKRLFPEAFANPAKTVDYQGPDKPSSTILSPFFATGR